MSLFIARSALELLLVSWLIFGQVRNGRRSSAGAERNAGRYRWNRARECRPLPLEPSERMQAFTAGAERENAGRAKIDLNMLEGP